MAKVLLIEDDATMLSLLRTLLEIEGFQVAILSAPDDLLAKVHQLSPQVIVLDVHLKNASGIELLRQIRQDADLRACRVLMASGMDLAEECRLAGADGFLMKPFMPDDLIRQVRQLAAPV